MRKKGNYANYIDLTGKVFVSLTVISRADDYVSPKGERLSKWHCFCDCGSGKTIIGGALRRGATISCGCLQRLGARKRAKHGQYKSRTYMSWLSMKGRCRPDNENHYSRYAGRGITICDRWSDFEKFYEDMGERPPRHTLDRVDNSLGYYKGNCKWSTEKEQQRNMRSNVVVEHNGQNMCLSEWAEKTGIKRETLRGRLLRGWSVKKMLETPTFKRK